MPWPMNSKRTALTVLASVLFVALTSTCFADEVKSEAMAVSDSAQSESKSVADRAQQSGTTTLKESNRSLAERTGAIAATPLSELPNSIGSITAIVRMIGALCAVLALMWVVVLFAKRYLRGRSQLANGSKQMSVVETLWLGPKKQIVLLSVGSRQVVIGVTDGTMTTLSELTIDEIAQPAVISEKTVKANMQASTASQRPFERLLVQAGGRLQQLLKQTNILS